MKSIESIGTIGMTLSHWQASFDLRFTGSRAGQLLRRLRNRANKRPRKGRKEVFLFTTKLVMRTYVMTLISEMGLSSRLSSQQASSTVNDPSADPSTEK